MDILMDQSTIGLLNKDFKAYNGSLYFVKRICRLNSYDSFMPFVWAAPKSFFLTKSILLLSCIVLIYLCCVF
jgi:hypothetical protein